MSRPRADVGDAARGRADETESVQRKVLVVLELALLHAEVERRAARRLEVEEPHVVRARLLDAEDGRGLSVAARARVLGLEVVLLVPRLEREAVVRADAERPAAGARDVDDALDEDRVVGAVVGHADLGNGPVARAELGRNRGGRVLVGDRLHAGERLLRAVPSARERALDGGDVRAGVLVQLVGRHREAARGRTRHADRAGRRLPFAVADAPLRGIELAEDRLLAVAESVRNVLHLRREHHRRDDRVDAVGVGENDRAVALADAELGVGFTRRPVGVALVAPDDLEAVRGHDARALDLHPLFRLRGVVVHVPAREVDGDVVVVAQLHPVELCAAVLRRGRLAVGGHHLVDLDDVGQRLRVRPVLWRDLGVADEVVLPHRLASQQVPFRGGERHDHGRAGGDDVLAVGRRDCNVADLDRHDADVRDGGDGEFHVADEVLREAGEVRDLALSREADSRHGGVRGDNVVPLAAVQRQRHVVDRVAHLHCARLHARGHLDCAVAGLVGHRAREHRPYVRAPKRILHEAVVVRDGIVFGNLHADRALGVLNRIGDEIGRRESDCHHDVRRFARHVLVELRGELEVKALLEALPCRDALVGVSRVEGVRPRSRADDLVFAVRRPAVVLGNPGVEPGARRGGEGREHARRDNSHQAGDHHANTSVFPHCLLAFFTTRIACATHSPIETLT